MFSDNNTITVSDTRYSMGIQVTGNLTVRGATSDAQLSITSNSDCIYADGDITLDGGSYRLRSNTDGSSSYNSCLRTIQQHKVMLNQIALDGNYLYSGDNEYEIVNSKVEFTNTNYDAKFKNLSISLEDPSQYVRFANTSGIGFGCGVVQSLDGSASPNGSLTLREHTTIATPAGGTVKRFFNNTWVYYGIADQEGNRVFPNEIKFAYTYTVSFSTGTATAIETQKILPDGKATKPADPTREGFTFEGWYSDTAYRTAYDFNAGVNQNMTLYAKWKEIPAPAPDPAPGQDPTPTPDPAPAPEPSDPVEAFVTRLYRKCLDREPDESGLNDWMTSLKEGKLTGAEAAYGFFASDEFKNRGISDEDYVEMLYLVMMNRASDEGGKTFWLKGLSDGMGRTGVLKGFTDSAEFQGVCDTYSITRGTITPSDARDQNYGLSTFVGRLYQNILGRAYDEDGINYWCEEVLSKKHDINWVASVGFFQSKEFANMKLNDSDYVKTLYHTFFDREYDQDGYDYWMKSLKEGMSRDEVLAGFLNSREFTELKQSYGL